MRLDQRRGQGHKSHQVTSQDKFFYDGSNNRITTDTVDKGDQYDYDGAKRLVTVLRGVPTAYINDTIASNISNTRYDDLIEYNLDQTGNRLTRRIDGSNDRTYAYNAANAMTTEAGTSQTYTTNGTWSGTSSVTNKYTWDDHYAWWDQGARQFTWHYDALGRQVARTRTGSGGASDIRLYYDGNDDVEVVSWISSAETLIRRMVYGERINELLEHTDISADPDVDYYNHADKLDSVMVLAENDGDIAESYRYKEYGEQTVVDSSFTKLSSYSSNIGNWKRYTGQEHALPSSFGDPWYFYRARVYRADAGRFVQRDVAGYADGSNRYVYVGLQPMDRTDPSGMLSLSSGGGGIPPNVFFWSPAVVDKDCYDKCIADNPPPSAEEQAGIDSCVAEKKQQKYDDCFDRNGGDTYETQMKFWAGQFNNCLELNDWVLVPECLDEQQEMISWNTSLNKVKEKCYAQANDINFLDAAKGECKAAMCAWRCATDGWKEFHGYPTSGTGVTY